MESLAFMEDMNNVSKFFCVLMTCHQVNGLSPRGLFVDCLRHLASGVTRGVADKFALSGKKFLLLASLLLPDNIGGKG